MSVTDVQFRPTTYSIAAMIRTLMGLRGVRRDHDLAQVLGVSDATVSRRLSGEIEFTGLQLAELADHFGVPVSVLYLDPADVVAAITETARRAGCLYVVDGDQGSLFEVDEREARRRRVEALCTSPGLLAELGLTA